MTPWTKIKKEYLEGVTPKELALKYKVKSKTIHEKASKKSWVDQKTSICKNLQEKTEDKLERCTNKSLDVCEQVLDDPQAKYSDKLTAANLVFSVNGMKKSKQETTNKNFNFDAPVDEATINNVVEKLKNF